MMLSKDITNNVFNLTLSPRELVAVYDALEHITSRHWVMEGYEGETHEVRRHIQLALRAQK